MTDMELRNLAEKYGTPTYVFDIEALQARVGAMKQILGNKIALCYSIKANPFLIPDILKVVDKLEVCSPGEMDICERLKVAGKHIVFSGVNKTLEDVEQAVRNDVLIYTAESKKHVDYLNEVACQCGKKIPVLLRLNAGSQFGMSKEDLCDIVEHRNDYAGIILEGIHYFVGTQRKKLEEQKNELEMLSLLFEELQEKYNFTVHKLEYGPGLPVPYFKNEDFTDTLKPLKEIAPHLQKMAERVELTVEMGRFIASECGYYLTRIMDQKSNQGVNYSIVDGGMNHLNYLGQMMGMKIPVIKHLKFGELVQSGVKNWCICGSICSTSDVVVRQESFEDLNEKDVLAFCNIGAYSVTEGIYLFLSRKMPRVVLYYGDNNTKLVRDYIDTSVLNCEGER